MGYYSAAPESPTEPVRPRDLLLLAGTLVLVTGAAFVWFAEPTAAGELAPPRQHADEPAAGGLEGDPADAFDPEHGATVRPAEAGVTEPVFRRESQPDTKHWTKGIIKGDIQLSTAVLDRITTLSIVVDELRSLHSVRDGAERPVRLVVPVHYDIGTPTFTVTDVPFSDYGYVVRVHAPGLNGSQQTVAITREQPYVDDVRLSVTGGAPFSLLLRDQDQQPISTTDVRLLPVGEPHGRPLLDGRTDNYGSAVFESVLAGDYQVLVGPRGQPMVDPPPVVTVQPGGRIYAGNVVQPQGQTVLVPRGVPLKVVVRQYGYGVEGVAIRAQAIDRIKLTVTEGRTDPRGEYTFPFLLPGIYQIDVAKDGFQRRSRQITLQAGAAPPDLEFELVRTP